MNMPHHRLARFTLWIMAALVAAVMAFGPTAASAHPGHEHRQHAVFAASAIAPAFLKDATPAVSGESLKAPATFRPTAAGLIAAPAEQGQDEHGGCGGVCCSGSSCCSTACLTAPARSIPAPVGMIERQPMPQGRAPDGVEPVALLRPPRLFA
jgi:hypothetical protein